MDEPVLLSTTNVTRGLRLRLFLEALVKAFVAALFGFGVAVLGLVLNPIFFARDAYKFHMWPWDSEDFNR